MKQKILAIVGVFGLLAVCVVCVTALIQTNPSVPTCLTGVGKKTANVMSVINVRGRKSLEEQAVSKEQEETQDFAGDAIRQMIDNMTLDQKLCQLMILTNQKDTMVDKLSDCQPGGVLLFSSDFKGKRLQMIKERIDEMQRVAEIPFLIAVDEEGGEVSRIQGMAENDVPVSKSPRELCTSMDKTVIEDSVYKKNNYLKSMGINMNFDPVADVVNNKNSYMYYRSASGDAEVVADYVTTAIQTMQEVGMGCCLKHFPGYGENANTHHTYVIDHRDMEQYETQDLIPFQAGINQGADMVMVSHIVVSAVDGENPASLSKRVHDYLRDELGYEGIVISDDLNMRAIMNQMNLETASAKAFMAGNDMIFSADVDQSMQGVKHAVERGDILEEQIDESLERVLRMKVALGILEL